MRVGVAAGLLVLGAAVGLATVWTHDHWWALALGAAATLTAEVAARAGLRRLVYAAGWLVAAAYFLLARPEGDLLVGSNPPGSALLGLGLLVLVLAVATLPPRRRMPDRAGPST